ncbi:MAG: hypothetical protein IIC09_04170 [Proteobacteria bacterium]|nr:hypothetical protein [Pseudomonadota bacterium]
MKPKHLGKGDKPSISGDPQDMGLNEREGYTHATKLRGETSIMKQQPEIKKGSIKSDRGTFPVK